MLRCVTNNNGYKRVKDCTKWLGELASGTTWVVEMEALEDDWLARASLGTLVVGHRGECRASSGACEGQETGADIGFLTEIGAANDDELNTGEWVCCGISATPEGQEIHCPCAH